MNGTHTKNNQAHKNNKHKKSKLKGCLCPFSATSQVGEEVRLSRRKPCRADTVRGYYTCNKKTVE